MSASSLPGPFARGPGSAWDPLLLIGLASLYWTVVANRAWIGAGWASGRDWRSVGLAVAMALMVTALQALLVACLVPERALKPVLAVLTVAAVTASYFSQQLGIVLDPTMMRNVLHTDVTEARELLSPSLLLHVLVFALPALWVLWKVRLRQWSWAAALRRRLLFAGLAALLVLASVWSVFQPFAALMRQQRELRYLIAPANVLYSTGATVRQQWRGPAAARQPIGLDARPGPSWATRTRPLVVVLVVGETARDANWALSGYPRPTTPRLAALPVINLPRVISCGTNTETSLPCMFAPVGRRDYDEDRILGQDSLLHLLARAGVAVHWRDNQSGCKGVCDGLPQDRVSPALAPGLCDGDRCLDEGLIADLPQRLQSARGTQLWVLHMLGNHGPAYHRRYPPGFAHFQPECRDDDLRSCTVPEVVNAYDNALRYTDHVLARTVEALQARSADVDSVMVYVSDHGESLGERGLFLHGLPYAVAPEVQKRVPMVIWASAGLESAAGLRAGCLAPALRQQAGQAADQPIRHDHLFHTLLGLTDVRTALHEPAWDLTAPCRRDAVRP